MFEEKRITARYIGATSGTNCLGREYVQMFFKVRGRQFPAVLQFNEGSPDEVHSTSAARAFMETHDAGAVAELVKVGAGAHAGFRLP